MNNSGGVCNSAATNGASVIMKFLKILRVFVLQS